VSRIAEHEIQRWGFVYLELMKWNENFANDIKKAKTKDELKKLWKTMKEKSAFELQSRYCRI